MLDETELREIATAFRNIIDNSDRSGWGASFANFPNGSCGDTSELFALYLINVINIDAAYVSARKYGKSHAWVCCNGILIDITADQFGQPPVIVTQESPWHRKWQIKIERPPCAPKTQWPTFPTRAWEEIVSKLKERGLGKADAPK